MTTDHSADGRFEAALPDGSLSEAGVARKHELGRRLRAEVVRSAARRRRRSAIALVGACAIVLGAGALLVRAVPAQREGPAVAATPQPQQETPLEVDALRAADRAAASSISHQDTANEHSASELVRALGLEPIRELTTDEVLAVLHEQGIDAGVIRIGGRAMLTTELSIARGRDVPAPLP